MTELRTGVHCEKNFMTEKITDFFFLFYKQLLHFPSPFHSAFSGYSLYVTAPLINEINGKLGYSVTSSR